MNLTETILRYPDIASHLREIKGGAYLFKQGTEASTMFLLLRGTIELKSQAQGNSSLVGLIEPGQILGEKAVLVGRPYRRSFSAKAKTDVMALELGPKEFEQVQLQHPDLMADIFRQFFLTSILRLDRANYLQSILRSSNNVERLIHLVCFFARCYGKPHPQGKVVKVTNDAIAYYIDLQPSKIDDCLNELLVQKLLVKQGPDLYLLSEEKALFDFVPTLSAQINSGHFDNLESLPLSTIG